MSEGHTHRIKQGGHLDYTFNCIVAINPHTVDFQTPLLNNGIPSFWFLVTCSHTLMSNTWKQLCIVASKIQLKFNFLLRQSDAVFLGLLTDCLQNQETLLLY